MMALQRVNKGTRSGFWTENSIHFEGSEGCWTKIQCHFRIRIRIRIQIRIPSSTGDFSPITNYTHSSLRPLGHVGIGTGRDTAEGADGTILSSGWSLHRTSSTVTSVHPLRD